MVWEFVASEDLVRSRNRQGTLINQWTERAIFRNVVNNVVVATSCEAWVWNDRAAQPTVQMRTAARDLILARLNEPPGPPVTLHDIIDELEELGQRALARGKTVQQIRNAAKRRLEDLIEELV